jgi:hypothetical protein
MLMDQIKYIFHAPFKSQNYKENVCDLYNEMQCKTHRVLPHNCDHKLILTESFNKYLHF